MRHGAGIFGELGRAQQRHILNTLHGTGVHISRKFGIPENGKSLLQTELEPITAGDTVTRPVMEILVCHHCFHALKCSIGSGLRVSKHTGGIEDVKPLVLHRTHVEEIHRHDHVDVEVVLTAIHLLVPAHGILERDHRMVQFVQILAFGINTQCHFTARSGGVVILNQREITCDQRKQVAGLGPGIFPRHPMTAAIGIA